MTGVFFNIGPADITAIVQHIKDMFSDMSLVIILIIGVAIGIWVITAILSAIRK